MNLDQFDWTAGLNQSGWIAAGLFVTFFIIAIIVITMILKLNADNKKQANNKTLKDLQEAAVKPESKARKVHQQKTKKTDKPASPKPSSPKPPTPEPSSPVDEAEVFITYGLNKQAIDLLEKHLEHNPADEAAKEMLFRAQAGT